MENCIFCKIVKGDIPSSKVYEDSETLAFLDIDPVNIGHTLVIPKAHFANVYETPEESLSEMIKVAKKVAQAIKSELKADGVNVTINNDPPAGQVVFHVHMHVIPRLTNDGFGLWHGRRGYEEGEREETVKKITAGLK